MSNTSRTAPSPPTGTLTFLFTDIEGSTRLWQAAPDAMRAARAARCHPAPWRRDALRLSTVLPREHAVLGRIRLYQGRYTEALAAFEQETVEWERKTGIALARFGMGQIPAADAALQEIIAHDAESSAIQIAEICAFRNEKNAAFHWLERAYVQHDHGVSLLRSHTVFRKLHDDPRWRPYLAKIGIAD